MTRPPTTYTRVTDAVGRLEVYARNGLCFDAGNEGHLCDCNDLQALRHLCEALDKLMRNNPVLADVLETYVADACDAVGVDGP